MAHDFAGIIAHPGQDTTSLYHAVDDTPPPPRPEPPKPPIGWEGKNPSYTMARKVRNEKS